VVAVVNKTSGKVADGCYLMVRDFPARECQFFPNNCSGAADIAQAEACFICQRGAPPGACCLGPAAAWGLLTATAGLLLCSLFGRPAAAADERRLPGAGCLSSRARINVQWPAAGW
jgi:hypothetical protein